MTHAHFLLRCHVVCCAMLFATCGVAELRCKQHQYVDQLTSTCTACYIPSELEIEVSPCNSTHNTVVTCADGTFNSVTTGPGVSCRYCGVCGTGDNLDRNYEIRSCSPTNDTKCCPRGNMKIGANGSCYNPDEEQKPKNAGDSNQESNVSNLQNDDTTLQNPVSNQKNESIPQPNKISGNNFDLDSHTHNKAIRKNIDYRIV
ncbi:uncharacterized protein LOC131954892 [Physella acuta]|uniref:uncharacterized protein LOC131954892 n=1 Tax=Physella acuta TaxID=109671 RepID=UPI0027DB7700|nr:uncharacterized protein LOC131954892 [Physella acuta]